MLLRVRPYREGADRYFAVNTRTARGRADRRARPDLPAAARRPGRRLPRRLRAGHRRHPHLRPGSEVTARRTRTGGWSSSGSCGPRAARTCCTSSTPPPTAAACCCRTTSSARRPPPRCTSRAARSTPTARCSPCAPPRAANPAGCTPCSAGARPSSPTPTPPPGLSATARWTGSATPTWSGPSPTRSRWPAPPCEPAPSAAVYEALAAAAERVLDRHHWLAGPEAGGLAEPLTAVRDTGRQVLDEYARVRELTAPGRPGRGRRPQARITALGRRVRGEAAALRRRVGRAGSPNCARAQGRLATLREHAVRRRRPARRAGRPAGKGVGGGRGPGRRATSPTNAPSTATGPGSPPSSRTSTPSPTAADADPLAAALDEQAESLATVTATAGTLEIADAAVRTRILALAADVLGAVNQARARARRAAAGPLRLAESEAEFAARERAARAERRAARWPPRTPPSAARSSSAGCWRRWRTWPPGSPPTTSGSPPSTAGARRSSRPSPPASRRSPTNAPSGPSGWRPRPTASWTAVRRRAADLASADEVHTFFASDPMASEHRRIAARVAHPGRPGPGRRTGRGARRRPPGRRPRAARPPGPLRGRRRHAPARPAPLPRQHPPLRPRARPARRRPRLHHHGHGLPRAGHATRVRLHPPLLVPPAALGVPDLYRAEYLAASLLLDALADGGAASAARAVPGSAPGAAGMGVSSSGGGAGPAPADPKLRTAAGPPLAAGRAGLEEWVRAAVADRPEEGYERGVHDHDAVLILGALTELAAQAGCCATRRTSAPRRCSSGPTVPVPPPARRGRPGPARWPGCGPPSARGPVPAPVPRPRWPRWPRSRPKSARAAGDFLARTGLADLAGLLGASGTSGASGPSGGDPAPAAVSAPTPAAAPVPVSAPAPGVLVEQTLGEYLVAELAGERPGFVASPGARELRARFAEALGGEDGRAVQGVRRRSGRAGRGRGRAVAAGARAGSGAFAAPEGDRVEAAAAPGVRGRTSSATSRPRRSRPPSRGCSGRTRGSAGGV